MEARTYNQLQKELSLKEFNKLAMKIAKRYANPNEAVSKRVLAEQNGIKASCCSQLLEYAVIHWLVSDKEISLMESRAVANEKANSESTGTSSYKHYDSLREKRKLYLKEVAQEYATSKEISISNLIIKCGRNVEGYFHMISTALTNSEKYDISFELKKQMCIRMLSDCEHEEQIANVIKGLTLIW